MVRIEVANVNTDLGWWEALQMHWFQWCQVDAKMVMRHRWSTEGWQPLITKIGEEIKLVPKAEKDKWIKDENWLVCFCLPSPNLPRVYVQMRGQTTATMFGRMMWWCHVCLCVCYVWTGWRSSRRWETGGSATRCRLLLWRLLPPHFCHTVEAASLWAFLSSAEVGTVRLSTGQHLASSTAP